MVGSQLPHVCRVVGRVSEHCERRIVTGANSTSLTRHADIVSGNIIHVTGLYYTAYRAMGNISGLRDGVLISRLFGSCIHLSPSGFAGIAGNVTRHH